MTDSLINSSDFAKGNVSQENFSSISKIKNEFDRGFLFGKNLKFIEALELARKAAKSSASILLSGESGTGKEVFANFIHKNSRQCKGPFVAVNCSSIPENLLESELFGHAKGSFTGAQVKRIGLFEAAENGTFLLDEIGDLSLSLQAKLLRVLQEKKIKRVGENKDIPINCRIISATHKDLSIEINAKRFREDLFFRLNVIPIFIPALRDRNEDVHLLAISFLKIFSEINHSNALTFSSESMDYILRNQWPGNIRELENAVQRAVILSTGSEVKLENFILPDHNILKQEMDPSVLQSDAHTFCLQYLNQLPSLEEVINKYIVYAVERNGGARDKAAKEIGIDRKTLYRRLKHDDPIVNI